MRFVIPLKLYYCGSCHEKGAKGFLPMRKDQEEKTKNPKNPLRHELETYEKQGVELRLDGQPGTPKTISRACRIAEEGNYMRDYIYNEAGDVKELSFDFVKKRK